MFHSVDNIYLFKKDVFVEKLSEKSKLLQRGSAPGSVQTRRNDCDLLNREADRICKEIEAR